MASSRNAEFEEDSMSLSRRRLLVAGTLTAAAGALAPVVSFADKSRKFAESTTQPDLHD